MDDPAAASDLFDGRYTLQKKLGEGSFGTTYLAVDTAIGLTVAIKVYRAVDEVSFRREVAATQFSNRNLVQILGGGYASNGQQFLVMEFLAGGSLAQLLRQGPLPPHRAAGIAYSVVRGLSSLHQRGFLHRDVKPTNVIFRDPGQSEPVLTDFGTAGQLKPTRLTDAGQVFGTPLYMSPEQVRGLPQSEATDVYQLGLLLYEMLAGHPLRAESDLGALFSSILREEPDLGAIAAAPALQQLVGECLRLDAALRPTIGKVVLALEQWSRTVASVSPTFPADAGPSFSHRPPSPAAVPSAKPDFAPAPAPSTARAGLSGRGWLVLGALVVVAALAAGLFTALPFSGTANGGAQSSLVVLAGLFISAASIALGIWIRGWLGRRTVAVGQVYALAARAEAVVDVTATIRHDLSALVASLQTIDRKVLAGTVMLMLDEYQRAADGKDRQAALMNVVQLAEKLADRLSPWYVRHKDAIASAVAVTGAISGLVTAFRK